MGPFVSDCGPKCDSVMISFLPFFFSCLQMYICWHFMSMLSVNANRNKEIKMVCSNYMLSVSCMSIIECVGRFSEH